MKSNTYLYNQEGVPAVPTDICNARIDLLQVHLAELLSVHWMEQDNQRINDVQAAQKFWRNLRDGDVL